MADLTYGLACGGYTYTLKYSSGPLTNPDISHYTLTINTGTDIQLSGTTSDFSWVGTHYFVIENQNGQADFSPTALGINGFFNAVDSNIFEITIIDPCLTSVVNSIAGLNAGIVSVPGKENQVFPYVGPTNSASVTYGNGYDICGPL